MNENDLVKQYDAALKAVCTSVMRKIRGDREIQIDESDLLQEARIALIGALRRFDESRAILFWTFAERCIQNRLRSWIGEERRQVKRKVAFASRLERFPPASPEDAAREGELLKKLSKTLAELSQENNKILLDRFMGEPSRAAAKDLGITASAVRLRLARLQSGIRKAIT